VSFKHRFRKVVLCLVIGMGACWGMPVRPEEIEALMHIMNQPKIMYTKPVDGESGGDPLEKLPGL
jgi:hypothetical protein